MNPKAVRSCAYITRLPEKDSEQNGNEGTAYGEPQLCGDPYSVRFTCDEFLYACRRDFDWDHTVLGRALPRLQGEHAALDAATIGLQDGGYRV